MAYKYSFQKPEENIAKAVLRDASISPKKSEIICDLIRYRTTAFAKRYLERVIEKKQAIPYKKYSSNAGHKPGIGPGRYPVNAAIQMLALIKSVEANASQKGLGGDLKIIHASAKIAARPMRSGRQRGVHMKRTHIEIAVMEAKQVKDKK